MLAIPRCECAHVHDKRTESATFNLNLVPVHPPHAAQNASNKKQRGAEVWDSNVMSYGFNSESDQHSNRTQYPLISYLDELLHDVTMLFMTFVGIYL